jgi:PAS domain S-box-containing protein
LLRERLLTDQHAVTELPASGALAALFAQRLAGVALVDRDLRRVATNDAFAALGPAAAPALEPLLTRALGGESLHEVDVGWPGGPERRLRGTVVPVHDGEQVVGALVVLVDAATGEHALQITRRRLDLALEGTGTGIYEWDLATDVIRWSENLGELWGRERGWSPADYGEYLATIHPDDREELSGQVRAAVETGAPYELDFRMLRPDGGARWMHTRGHVVRDESGAPEALIGLVSDIQERRMAQEAAKLLAAASAALASSPEPEESLHELAAMTAGALADWCAVHVAEPGGDVRLVAVAHADPARGPLAEELERRSMADAQVPARVAAVLRSGRAELYTASGDELPSDEARDTERLARELDLRSALIVPMIAGGEVLGTISFFFAGPADRYAAEWTTLAEELGRRAGVALSNARLHRAQAQAAFRLRRLQAITDVALSQLPVDELLSALLVRVRDLLRADFAVCLLIDPDEKVLVERAQVGLGPRRDLRIRPGHGIAGRILLEDRVVIVPDVPAARPASEKLAHKARSLMGAPLRVEGHTLGVLHVSTAQPRGFTPDEEELLTLAADRVARAVEQAAAYERVRSTAMTLQRTLLPESLPAVEGLTVAARYLPGQEGSEVGGDWYDVVALRDGRTAVCVGDVGGRGVAAAAVMGRLRASLRACLHVCDQAAEARKRVV